MNRIFLILSVFILLSAGPAYAQSYVHDSGWTVGANTPQPHLQPGQQPLPQQDLPPPDRPSVDEAWDHVWSPIQDISGWRRSSAETILNNTSDRMQSDSNELMGNARAWSVIAADLGIGSLFRGLASDWFVFTTTEIPQHVIE